MEEVTIIHKIHTLRIILCIITHAKRTYNAKNKMKDNNYINNIAAIRKKHGISQTQFANAIGVETSTISRIETGKSDPSAVTLFAIAKYLQVSVDELYTRKTAEQIKNEREQEFFKRNIRYYVSTVESKENS